MPDHLLRVHPFVAFSYPNPSRGDLEEGQDMEETTVDILAADGGENGDTDIVSNVQLDQRRGFVVEDNPQLGPEAFLVTKNVGASGASVVGQKKISAVAVQEQGTEKFAKVLRFM
ncbi:hypothetical protein BWQ96_03185 [Gracilariopsis chorda]|uniref:Uncharacterized protein n=1 Tax=Gracilariopsis chorda TaxID=448386 RepID=A0A2V3IBI6_9FLOR|nr:hypothetical protein BWQ96_10836 [Gracilariopsis chorda]PXF46995.1 hypothetical protein BWQ96_03185 [Gracilariopsis chorda]|eukprot:PXF39476.1 hypothetical protein BWQ96_10836 [Gracilariopsis chorda]